MLLEDVFEPGEVIANRIMKSYTQQAAFQVYKLIGSHDLLGNPAAIFADVGGGVRQFFHEQRKGQFIKSPTAFAHSIASLTGNVVGASGALTLGATSGMAKGMSAVAATMAFDAKYNYRRQLVLQKEARSMRQGLYLGSQLLGGGVVSGVAGLVRQPVKGARDAGAKGFAKGVGKGTIGLFAKTTSGMSAGISKVAEGVASDMKHLTGNSEAAQSTLRIRQPRELVRQDGSGPAVLLPYPRFNMDF